jgi:hypothetical protein
VSEHAKHHVLKNFYRVFIYRDGPVYRLRASYSEDTGSDWTMKVPAARLGAVLQVLGVSDRSSQVGQDNVGLPVMEAIPVEIAALIEAAGTLNMNGMLSLIARDVAPVEMERRIARAGDLEGVLSMKS